MIPSCFKLSWWWPPPKPLNIPAIHKLTLLPFQPPTQVEWDIVEKKDLPIYKKNVNR